MRTALVVYPVRRVSVPTVRRKTARIDGFGKMLGKLDAASAKLAQSRPRR